MWRVRKGSFGIWQNSFCLSKLTTLLILPLNRGNPYNPCMDFWMSSSKMPVFPGKHIITIFMTSHPFSCAATLYKNLLILFIHFYSYTKLKSAWRISQILNVEKQYFSMTNVNVRLYHSFNSLSLHKHSLKKKKKHGFSFFPAQQNLLAEKNLISEVVLFAKILKQCDPNFCSAKGLAIKLSAASRLKAEKFESKL